MSERKNGNTLPELLMALAILTLLFGLATLTLLRSQRVSSQSASTGTLLSDLRDQQSKAMSQNTEGVANPYDFGIHFADTAYTLFKGVSFNPADSTNFTVELDPSIKMSNTTFPSSTVLFKAGSGEVSGFTEGSNTVTLEDLTNTQTITITLNSYGVPTE